MPYVRRRRFTRRPYRRLTRRTRRPTRRLRFRTRRRGTRTTMRNANPGQLIAPRYITKLKYVDGPITLSIPLADTSVDYQFNLNSIYDPNRTGLGHQPMGHDQLQLLYNRYRVFAVSYRVEFYAIPSPQVTYFVTARNDGHTSTSKNLSEVRETPHTIVKVGYRDQATVISGRLSLPRLTGQTSFQYKSGMEYQALFGGSPTELMTLNIGAIPLTSLSAATATFTVQLMYHVELFDPKTLEQS